MNKISPFRIVVLLTGAILLARGQASPPDEIIFTNGDKLGGHFVEANGKSVIFKNDVLGELTIDWAEVKELHTSGKVAVIRKGVKLEKYSTVTQDIPQGTLAMENQTIQLTPAVPPIPVGNVAAVVDQGAFQAAMTEGRGFTKDWTGNVVLGVTLVEATQTNHSFSAAASVVRTEPKEDWLTPQNRTSFNYSQSYGKVTQPATPSVKTSILHFDGERDEYLTRSVFVFGAAAFDRNYSQGLTLQQTYMAGVGWTVINDAHQVLDFKAAVSYVQQQFSVGPTKNLIGSFFGEHYNHKFVHDLSFDQHASITPGWNDTSAYSTFFSAFLAMPVYKGLGWSTGVVDSYLNNPPPGFKKNSFQFIAGLTYAIQ